MAPQSWPPRLPVPHPQLPNLHRPQNVDPLAWTKVLERRYIRARLVGWLLIGAWQVLSLASEFWTIDLESRAMRITGKALGLVGLVLVAWGFERIVHLNEMRRRITERKADAAESAALAQKK